MKPSISAALAAVLVVSSFADAPTSPPVLEFATGLPGQQVHLSWVSEAGLRYTIEKSADLGSDGGGWTRVAIVEATASVSEWTDPTPRGTRAFYRIVQPQAEVFSIEEPVLSATGATLVVHGQCIPDGSFLMLEIEGMAPVFAELVTSDPGQWTATFSGGFIPGANVLSATVTDGGGATVCPVDVDISITETGFAADAPPNSLPPAAPVPLEASNPVPGIGVIVKKHPGNGSAKRAGPGDYLDDDDDGDGVPTNASIPVPGVGVVVKSGKGGGKQHRASAGGGGDCDDGDDDVHPASAIRLSPGRNGMPGEVCLEYDALTLVCPAGPPIAWIMTYRSVADVSSGHGPGWDFAYDVSIDATASNPARLRVTDGAGRADEFRRASDGTYRADGFSRVGQFSGDVFTLTFANGGTWTFRSVNDPIAPGQIDTITDPNGNAVTCSYDGTGKLASVSSSFGQSVAITWSGDRIASVTDHTGRSVGFSYDGSGMLESIGCPTASGLPPAAGPTIFAYSSGTGTPRLDGNLLSVTDGAGRVLESFTYAAATIVGDPEFDMLATHSAHELGHHLGMSHEVVGGLRMVYENDEHGRVRVSAYDKLHRLTRCRVHTGFHPSPGGAVSSSDFPLSGKLRTTDPDYFETTWSYNADSNVTSMTGADGSKMLTTYERDLNPACATIERGNARVQTLVSSIGEKRSITMEYQPNSGTPECARPGNPIGGLLVKGGKNPGGNPSARPGNPIGGLNIKVGKNPGGSYRIKPGFTTRRRVEVLKSNKTGDPNANRGITINTSHVEYATANRLVWSPRSNIDGPDDDCDGLLIAFLGKKGYDYYQAQGSLKSTHLSKKGYDYYQAQTHRAAGGWKPKGWDGTVKGSARLAGGDDVDNDCDSQTDDEDDIAARPGQPIKGISVKSGRSAARLTRLTTSHGQVFSWTYDAAGNCTSATSPIAGGGAVYVYDAQGRLSSITESNGAASDFHDTLAYGPDGFLQTYTEDATAGGRNLATTFEYDTLGRCTRVVDPMSADWLLHWSPLDVCTRTESPPIAGERIATDFAYDASGRLVRCDVDHRDASGTLDVTNPSYSTFWSYDARGRLVRIAAEERPTDTTGLLEPDPLTRENFAVTDFTYDDAGQVIRASTPAACRGQASDTVVDLTYDERGLLHRVVAGGSGNPGAVTTAYDYDTLGACVREACVTDSGGALTTLFETLYSYDGFHRPSSVTDAMGNETVFTYDGAGRVTTSVFGEVEDIPGSAGNVLLARSTAKLSGNGWESCSGGALQLRTGPTGFRYHRWSWGMDSGGSVNSLLMPALMKAKERGNRTKCGNNLRTMNPFLDVETEDDVIEVERFTQGSTPPFAKETTVIDRSPAGLVMAVTRNGDLLDSFGYDSSGALTSISNAARTIDLNRDDRQDIVVCGRTDHFRVPSPPTPKTFSHTITRNPLGRITAVTDGAGNASSFAYDSLGRSTSLAAPGRPPVTFVYDGTDPAGDYGIVASCDIEGTGSPTELGRFLLRCGVPVSSADSNGYPSGFTYDALGRLTRCDRPDGTFEAATYDARGFVTSVTHQDGSTTDLTNDLLGRTIEGARNNLQLGTLSVDNTFCAYDGLGRLVRATQGASIVAMTWDSVGNPTSETSNGLTISRTFNHRGRTSVTYPGGSPIPETRNEFGQLTNAGGNLVRHVGMRIYQTEQTNGVVTTYDYRGEGDSVPPGDASYDSCVRVTSVSGAATLCDTLIRHAPDQRVTKATMLFTAEPTGPGRVRTYTHDGLGRVTACLTERRDVLGLPPVTESDVSYTLDTAGRRVSVTGGTHPGSYTQDSSLPTDMPPGPGDHQMGQYTSWPGGNLEWDDLGNLTVFTNGPDYLDLDSDGDGLVRAVNDGATGTPVVSYTYDALGRLASRNGGGTITTFVWDGPRMVQELDDPNGAGELSAGLTFVCGDGGVRHCISTRNGTYLYPINSQARLGPSDSSAHFGHAIALGDDSGVVLERYDYDEAGELLLLDDRGAAKTSGIGPVRWMAPEALRDRSTGFVHGHGTVYSPPLGRQVNGEKFHVTETYGQTAATRSRH